MEARGVEPLSENPRPKASPSAVCVLNFPSEGSRRRDRALGSFISADAAQSFAASVPCLYDAGGLRRRRLRVDGSRLGGYSVTVIVRSYCFSRFYSSSGLLLASFVPAIPVETKYAPVSGPAKTVVYSPLDDRRRERVISRSASFLAMSSRLS